MSRDHEFEIEFYESVFRRDTKDTAVVELLANLYTKVGRVDDGLKMDRKLVRLCHPERVVTRCVDRRNGGVGGIIAR